ncbi:EamA family transporter, partial [Candidatus Peregrinibacteria bacterium]|nr:EamA family transporter [Candidatus Peregrinibacteria bacterium]
ESGGQPTYFRLPVYPLFLAGVYSIFGHNYLIAKLAGAAIDSLAVVIFMFIALNVFNNPMISMITGIFLAIYPPLLVYNGIIGTEILFTFLICGLFFNEKITTQKILGGLAVLIGATIILYKKSFQFNIGDILIIAGTFFYPIGNIFAKKALKITSPSVILFMRSIIGGMLLLLISFYFEKFAAAPLQYAKENWKIILLNGAIVYLVSKLLWYQGFKYIDISKAISISMAMPAISLVYAAAFLHEIPTIQQTAGFVVVVTGLLLLTRQKKYVECSM